MKAYKCDICDKLYTNPTDFAERTDPVTGSAIAFIPSGLLFTGNDGFIHTNSRDVCPDCIAFFRKLIPEIRFCGLADWKIIYDSRYQVQ